MPKNLVIIESKGKIGSYKKALGSDYSIMASYGHCVDLPSKGLSIDLKNNFEPTFKVLDDKKDVVNSLKKQAKNAEAIYLMTDEDREGEAIAYHIKNILEKETKAVIYRATTNEITASGIRRAIDNPSCLDEGKINAYMARRLLDRLCGYKTSFLTQQATGGKSAGRVQSAILRIIVDREKEIINFVPEEYWVLTAHLLSENREAYDAVLEDKVKVPNEEEATKIYDNVIKGKPLITSVESKNANVNPYPPFVTSTMQQTASTNFGWSAAKTMQVAQGLYENGLITYMRTDSPFMAQEAVDAVRCCINSSFGENYLHDSVRTFKAKKGAQEAHECCRVTDIANRSPSVSGDERRLYDMIWKRTVATQMKSGIDERTKVVTKIGSYNFVTRGNVVIFDGFRRVWDYGNSEDRILPKLTEGEKPTLQSLDKEQKWTKPPPRYSDASLSKQCEDLQVSRPATFANFLKILEDRGYISRVKRSFQATELGIRVVDFLTAADVCFVDVAFTANMESLLDEIQSNETTRDQVLQDFWTRLQCDIERGKQIKSENELTDYDCPNCSGKLALKHSRFGPFFSCQNYKKPKTDKDGNDIIEDGACLYTAKVGENGEPVEKKPACKEYADFECRKCKSKMVKRKSKYGEFFGCEGFPKCKETADLEGTFKEPKQYNKKKYTKKKSKKKSKKK